ncbi:hypothetical protein RchiOBHm_Chr7g0220701 [Rosa chinensis]|uniref:Coiled-coil domain-containing protein 47 n=1 Tax=Rosa chinensis TaxID=74649 RepID=A0A2P6PCU7_ROSCH|nr:uncharacterized protein At5g49945 [Rosa chinensis]PRQ19753.1 hypothetical protein RchiOBHm_Chr7g0220701 [Rosa chinensis]
MGLAVPHLLTLFLFFSLICFSPILADSDFEGFEDADDIDEDLDSSLPLTTTHPSQTLLTATATSQPDPVPDPSDPVQDSDPASSTTDSPKPSSTSFEYWDEDEFEGLPQDQPQQPPLTVTENATPSPDSDSDLKPSTDPKQPPESSSRSYTVEIACGGFLIVFIINYFTGKRMNENLALAWAAKFATKDTIFDKNFSLLGVGEGDDSPLLLKEGQNVFKFYASGRRCCQGLLATMELKSRHDLISSIFNLVVPISRDEISFEVYMNDDAMDHVVFAVAKKKAAKAMQKEVPDLQKFATILSPPAGRKWVAEDLAVISESKEVAGDLITEAVLDQVFGEKAFQKFGKGFMYMHFSDQHPGPTHKKMLLFKYALPDADSMADMTRLVALIPYYIDLIGRYKLSSQARSKTEATRSKAAQEAYKELQNARQEALQRKKAERKKLMEEAEAKLSAESIRKKEAKERARQMKKAMPKMKMTRAS